jgi:hypothetical protein
MCRPFICGRRIASPLLIAHAMYSFSENVFPFLLFLYTGHKIIPVLLVIITLYGCFCKQSSRSKGIKQIQKRKFHKIFSIYQLQKRINTGFPF